MRFESLQSMQDSMDEDMDQRYLLTALNLLEEKAGLNRKEAKDILLLFLKELNQDEQFQAEKDHTVRMSKLLAKVTGEVQDAKEKAVLNKIMEDMQTIQALGAALSNSGVKMDARKLAGRKARSAQISDEMYIQTRLNNKNQSKPN